MSEMMHRFAWLEDLGIEVVAIGDHFTDWTKPDSSWFESWTLLSAAAARTSRIRLMTAVTQIPLRNPALLARQAMTVDHISDGRLEVGLGTGIIDDPSCEMMGLPNWSARERVDRFGEYVEIVARLLSNSVSTFEGEYYSIHGATMNPGPVQRPRPPIMVAAMGPRMMQRAAQHADTWNSLSFHNDFEAQMEETRARAAQMRGLCEAGGRDPDEMRWSYTMFDADARSKGGAIGYYESADRFEEMAERAVALGMSEIGLYFPLDESQRPMFERIATQVLPRMRAKHAKAD